MGQRGPGARRREDTHHGDDPPPSGPRGGFQQAVAGQPLASQTTCGRVIAFTRAWGRSSGRRFPPIASGGPGVASVRLRPPGPGSRE